MTETAGTYFFLCASAFVAGVMNSVAGGGTLLTFPALTGVVSPALANATSTVALLPGSLAAAVGYRQEVAAVRKFVLRMLAPSLIGGYVGARLVSLDKELFAALVPWLILTAAVLFLVQQRVSRWMRAHRPDHEPGPLTQVGLIGFQFLVAVYGGYFGAGIGILMLAALGFMGVGDIHRMNAAKTILAAAINVAAVVEFVRAGLVDWRYALPMAVAAILGGYAGARVARRMPPGVVRWAVIGIGFGLAAYYFVRQYAAH
jgi:uncharacterized membrane protein YfcA